MKKFTLFFIFFYFIFNIEGNGSAADVQMLAKETSVNTLMTNGWKLHTVSSSDYIITYTLIKKDEVVTCKVLSNDNIKCFKP